jgi:hypothetical protein
MANAMTKSIQNDKANKTAAFTYRVWLICVDVFFTLRLDHVDLRTRDDIFLETKLAARKGLCI